MSSPIRFEGSFIGCGVFSALSIISFEEIHSPFPMKITWPSCSSSIRISSMVFRLIGWLQLLTRRLVVNGFSSSSMNSRSWLLSSL